MLRNYYGFERFIKNCTKWFTYGFFIDCINFELMKSWPLLFFAFMDVMILHTSISSVGDINIDRAL